MKRTRVPKEEKQMVILGDIGNFVDDKTIGGIADAFSNIGRIGEQAVQGQHS